MFNKKTVLTGVATAVMGMLAAAPAASAYSVVDAINYNVDAAQAEINANVDVAQARANFNVNRLAEQADYFDQGANAALRNPASVNPAADFQNFVASVQTDWATAAGAAQADYNNWSAHTANAVANAQAAFNNDVVAPFNAVIGW